MNLTPTSASLSKHYKKPPRSLRKTSAWQLRIHKELAELEKKYPGHLGLYIKDLSTGEEYAYHADENWYLASTVKVPMAIEVLRQVDAKKLSLSDSVEILPEDYVDGNGPLKFMEPGTKVTIRFLIEQMITLSDNMASDMLLRVAGLENVNKLLKETDHAFLPVTTLKDVRKHIYSGIHPRANELSGMNLLELGSLDDQGKRYSKFVKLLDLKDDEIRTLTLDGAYKKYYEGGLNSATPRTYSKVLEALWEGKFLSHESREFLIRTMMKTQTGSNRIKAGLKRPWVFAHKTGTQFKRIGDVGFILDPKNSQRKPLLVVSFVKDMPETKSAAKLLEKVGEIISSSGVL